MAGNRPGKAATLNDLAEACGISTTTLTSWRRNDSFPQSVDGIWDIYQVGFWRGQKEELDKLRTRHHPEDDLLGDGESEGLERYRMAKAQLAELDLAEREKEMLPADQVRDGVAAISLAFRQAGETLQRQFGPEAHAILEGAVSEAETQINGMFGTDDDASHTDAT